MSENRRETRRDTRNIGSYILGATLGEGAFGQVFKVKRKVDGK